MVRVAQGLSGPATTPPQTASRRSSTPCRESSTEGFASWDDFFTRRFCPGVRPVTAPNDDSVIANACESAPLQVVRGVRRQDAFWLKGQPYSLDNLLDFDPRAAAFEGGTLYQAFLSALSYHRWHSPVSGTVRSVRWSAAATTSPTAIGVSTTRRARPERPNQSQPFLTAVATRALIFIEADNPKIGLMCVVPVGMAEVSSCEVTVQPGQRIAKGEQLGMFHFGGSTHRLLFPPRGRAGVRLLRPAAGAGGDQPEDQHGAGAGRITPPPIARGRLRAALLSGLLPEKQIQVGTFIVGRALPQAAP